MPTYTFKCDFCNARVETTKPVSEYDLINFNCCHVPMTRDYSADNAGFIPTDGMYAKDSRKS